MTFEINSMTFSEFAQLLYPYCGNGMNHAEFVKTLTNKMMAKPGHNIKDKYLNPLMNQADNTLQKYFKGTRQLSAKTAGVIMAHSDPYRFEKYIDGFSDNAREGIAKALCKFFNIDENDNIINRDNVAEKCADIMNEILKQAAKK